MKNLGVAAKQFETQMSIITEISEKVGLIYKDVEAMTEERKKANNISDTRKKAFAYCNKVIPYFERIRYNSDKLELITDDELWQLPKYRELLFFK